MKKTPPSRPSITSPKTIAPTQALQPFRQIVALGASSPLPGLRMSGCGCRSSPSGISSGNGSNPCTLWKPPSPMPGGAEPTAPVPAASPCPAALDPQPPPPTPMLANACRWTGIRQCLAARGRFAHPGRLAQPGLAGRVAGWLDQAPASPRRHRPTVPGPPDPPQASLLVRRPGAGQFLRRHGRRDRRATASIHVSEQALAVQLMLAAAKRVLYIGDRNSASGGSCALRFRVAATPWCV